MTVERDGRRQLVLPKLEFGNVILMPQPARGANMDARLQHNDRVPPNHQYLAAYWWLQREFEADAIVNYGTHGTHEFLPGRPLGQLADDWSDITLGRMPNVYVYIMDNVGEALIAKRRGSAVTVDHQVPPIGAASLSEADPEIGELYRAAEQFVDQEEGSLKERLREQIAKLGKARALDEDLGLDWTERLPTDEEVAELKLHIHLINEDRIPLGLHVHSQNNPASEAAQLVTSMVGSDYVRRVASDEMGLQVESGTRWEAAKQRAVRHVEAALEGRRVAAALRPDEDRVRTIFASLRLTSREIPQTLHALEGGYIPPGAGGDPVRNPAALPTARNLYGINPQEVPTRAAWEVGVSLADALLDAERERLGRYPKKIGFTLWNTELIRHYGTDLAQILHLIGVRPVWDHNGIVADLDLVPVEELGRPRIDVVIQAASLFRDTFPDRMEFLDKAVRLAAAAADGDNFIADHVEESQIALKRAGMSAEDARLYAGARVFSNNVGGYGTGVIDNTIRSGDFEDTAGLTEEYLARVGAVYTEGAEWGANVEGLYAQALAGTEARLPKPLHQRHQPADAGSLFRVSRRDDHGRARHNRHVAGDLCLGRARRRARPLGDRSGDADPRPAGQVLEPALDPGAAGGGILRSGRDLANRHQPVRLAGDQARGDRRLRLGRGRAGLRGGFLGTGHSRVVRSGEPVRAPERDGRADRGRSQGLLGR